VLTGLSAVALPVFDMAREEAKKRGLTAWVSMLLQPQLALGLIANVAFDELGRM
jgi:hypothetical protein